VEFAEFVPHGLEFQSEWSNGNAERLGCSEKAVIVGCEFDRLTAPQQKADRGNAGRQVCALERERAQGLAQDGRRKFDQRDTLNESACLLAMRPS
jgi:hypothetical protein